MCIAGRRVVAVALQEQALASLLELLPPHFPPGSPCVAHLQLHGGGGQRQRRAGLGPGQGSGGERGGAEGATCLHPGSSACLLSNMTRAPPLLLSAVAE